MEHPHEPMDAIKNWQDWYKNNQQVAQMDEPLITKDSRENLHDTSKATDVFTDWRSFYKEMAQEEKEEVKQQLEKELINKATSYFADTIAEFLPELGGKKLYECFVAAATDSMLHAEKEYDNNKDLIDLLGKKKK